MFINIKKTNKDDLPYMFNETFFYQQKKQNPQRLALKKENKSPIKELKH